MTNNTSFKLVGDLTVQSLEELDIKARRAMYASAQFTASDAESFMKGNAPWTDRTGNARNGLRATVEVPADDRVAIVLYHSVPYGPWLELRWAGKYGIILDGIAHSVPVLLASLKRLLFSKG